MLCLLSDVHAACLFHLVLFDQMSADILFLQTFWSVETIVKVTFPETLCWQKFAGLFADCGAPKKMLIAKRLKCARPCMQMRLADLEHETNLLM